MYEPLGNQTAPEFHTTYCYDYQWITPILTVVPRREIHAHPYSPHRKAAAGQLHKARLQSSSQPQTFVYSIAAIFELDVWKN